MKRGRKAQETIGMSFGTIFSIILIIFFIIVAFIAIRYFLELRSCTEISSFVNELQSGIDTAWNSQKSDFEFKSNLPSGIKQVCFFNYSKSLSKGDISEEISFYSNLENNLYLYPQAKACDIPSFTLKHINLLEITKIKNPYCIPVENGKIIIRIQKSFDSAQVTLK
jgi:hypothetical protein